GASGFLLWGACPQPLAGDAGALSEGTELRPGNRWQHSGCTSEGREAAVDTGDDILASHEVRIAHDPLGYEFLVLDEVGCRVDHTRDDAFPIRQLHFLEDVPFVLLTGFTPLEGARRG